MPDPGEGETVQPLGPWPGDPLGPTSDLAHRPESGRTRRPAGRLLPARPGSVPAPQTPSLDPVAGPSADGGSGEPGATPAPAAPPRRRVAAGN